MFLKSSFNKNMANRNQLWQSGKLNLINTQSQTISCKNIEITYGNYTCFINL